MSENVRKVLSLMMTLSDEELLEVHAETARLAQTIRSRSRVWRENWEAGIAAAQGKVTSPRG